jgi:hypothetical protein
MSKLSETISTEHFFAKFLNKEELKNNLLLASLYLTGYELLKNHIVIKLKDFFLCGFNENGFIYSEDYKEVTKKHKKIYEASCMWLADMNAISQDDIIELQKIREHRDEIAHDLPKLLTERTTQININLLYKMKSYIDKIGNFWGSIEADTNIDLVGENISYNEIKSGSSIIFDYILTVFEEIKDNK